MKLHVGHKLLPRQKARLTGGALKGLDDRMQALFVLHEGILVGEAPLTENADMRPLARVHPLVHRERPPVKKLLIAHVARVVFMRSVRFLVRGQATPLRELFVAHFAHVGPLARVDPDVARLVRLVGEAFVADAARKWPLPRVRCIVLNQGGLAGEALLTDGARVRLHTRVGSLVLLQAVLARVALGAESAGKRLLSRVLPHMGLEVAFPQEVLVAHEADVGPRLFRDGRVCSLAVPLKARLESLEAPFELCCLAVIEKLPLLRQQCLALCRESRCGVWRQRDVAAALPGLEHRCACRYVRSSGPGTCA